MKIVKNNYQKTLGHTVCKHCGSVLCIQRTDVLWTTHCGKCQSYFICGACGHEQIFKRKELTSKKKALEDTQEERNHAK